jgi:hypothetical protein
VQGYIGRRFDYSLIDFLEFNHQKLQVQKQQLIRNNVKYIVIHKQRIIRDGKKEIDPKFSYEREDLSIRKILEMIASYYSKTYTKIYEDKDAAVFKVY